MRFTVLVLALVCQALADGSSITKQKEEGKTDKRALEEGVKKRTPDAVSPTPLPAIEYADVKVDDASKAAQHIYATPVPQVAKISDVLTGQAQVPFPAAIAHHLFSPVSVYQPRLGSPTTYEVSAPVPSKLAYSEHKIYQTPPVQNLPPQPARPTFGRFTLNVNPAPEQPVYYQQQPVVYQQPPQFVSPPQLFQYNQFPQPQYHQSQAYTQIPQPVPYSNSPSPIIYPQNNIQPHVQYNHNQQPFLQVFHSIQPGVTYARQQNAPSNGDYSHQQESYQPNREFKAPAVQKQPERLPTPQQDYNDKSQGAVSYASFSQSQPNYAPPQNQNPLPQQFIPKSPETAPANSLLPKSPPQQVLYLRPGHIQNQHFQNLQYQSPQLPPQQYQNQPQPYRGHGILVQNPGYVVPQPLQLSPLAPVQYYGKFAESIFGNYQQ